MRDALRGILIGIALLAVGGALAGRLDIATIHVPRTSGTAVWLISRVSGLTAFVALSIDVILGLLVSTRASSQLFAKGAAVELHRWLSPLTLALVLGHGALLLADGYIRFDALAVLVPFASPYRPLAVAIGVLAGYLALVVHVSFALRKRLGAKRWRRLHYLSFVVLVGAAAHGLLAGSDTGSSWVRMLYVVSMALTVALVGHRVGLHYLGAVSKGRRQSPARAREPSRS